VSLTLSQLYCVCGLLHTHGSGAYNEGVFCVLLTKCWW